MSIRVQGFSDFKIVETTTVEELEYHRKNNFSIDADGFLRSDQFVACMLKKALEAQNFILVKHIIDLRPDSVNFELDSYANKWSMQSYRKPLTPLCCAIRLPGYSVECNKTALRIVTYLCAQGADVNRFVDSKTPYTEIKRSNYTPLYSAADRACLRNLEFVKTLICFGARHAMFPPLPEGERYQEYQPENISLADISIGALSKVKEMTHQARNALYSEHRNIFLVQYGRDQDSKFKNFPAEIFMHFARVSIQHCYRSVY